MSNQTFLFTCHTLPVGFVGLEGFQLGVNYYGHVERGRRLSHFLVTNLSETDAPIPLLEVPRIKKIVLERMATISARDIWEIKCFTFNKFFTMLQRCEDCGLPKSNLTNNSHPEHGDFYQCSGCFSNFIDSFE